MPRKDKIHTTAPLACSMALEEAWSVLKTGEAHSSEEEGSPVRCSGVNVMGYPQCPAPATTMVVSKVNGKLMNMPVCAFCASVPQDD